MGLKTPLVALPLGAAAAAPGGSPPTGPGPLRPIPVVLAAVAATGPAVSATPPPPAHGGGAPATQPAPGAGAPTTAAVGAPGRAAAAARQLSPRDASLGLRYLLGSALAGGAADGAAHVKRTPEALLLAQQRARELDEADFGLRLAPPGDGGDTRRVLDERYWPRGLNASAPRAKGWAPPRSTPVSPRGAGAGSQQQQRFSTLARSFTADADSSDAGAGAASVGDATAAAANRRKGRRQST